MYLRCKDIKIFLIFTHCRIFMARKRFFRLLSGCSTGNNTPSLALCMLPFAACGGYDACQPPPDIPTEPKLQKEHSYKHGLKCSCYNLRHPFGWCTLSLFPELLTRLELVTSSLPRKCSTTELQQQLLHFSGAKVIQKKLLAKLFDLFWIFFAINSHKTKRLYSNDFQQYTA